MRKINLMVIMLVCFGLYIVNSFYHPLVNISFSKDEINANLTYYKWITENKSMYEDLKNKYYQQKTKEETENKVNENKVNENKNNFVRPSQRKKEIETTVTNYNRLNFMMWRYRKNKDYDKAFLIIDKYDKSYKKLMERMDITKKISNFFVMMGLLLAIFLWFRRKG